MMRIIVIGAAGRMGKRVISCVDSASDMELAGATEYAQSPMLGLDAGTIAGVGDSGVSIAAELQPILANADAIIDFSTGDVIENARLAVAAGLSVVIGTTALTDDQKAELANLAAAGGKIVLAPNMSVGVNTLFHLATKTAEILGEGYDIEIVEMHHNQKKDAPSGTAVRLGECVAEGRNISYQENAVHGREGIVGERTPSEIGMHAVRGGDVVGDHTVIFATAGERVELTHKASSRDTFAMGALKAVRFLAKSESGLYDMQDVLGLRE
ncbi:MAG: 4-hydroxy-tetrahydrodipicolinate reductase [Victivallales bacterium]|nr:4-hydroxy-tetrahydrodipicolinate reductase [Victivallales bacterium]